MSQKLSTPIEQAVVGPHIRHPNPHPQYALASSVTPTPGPSTSTPATQGVGSTGLVGTSTDYARADHRHPMPGLATTTTDGFMSAADKTALAAIGLHPVISPLDGALLDIDNGTLVWDVDTLEQVLS